MTNEESVMLNNLFSKYGFNDGQDEYCDAVHAALSQHLRERGFDNQIVTSVHNRRVATIKIGDSWYDTESLVWGQSWELRKTNSDATIMAPKDLRKAIIDFLPQAFKIAGGL